MCVVYKNKLLRAIKKYLVWSEAHSVAGPFLMALIISLTVITLLPYSIVAVSAGWAFNQTFERKAVAVTVGSTAVFAGAWLGAMLSFLLGRYLVRDQVKSLVEKFKLIRSLDKTFESQGKKFVFLMRVCLLVPFGVSNYVLGGSAVLLKDYAIGSLGLIFQSIFYVYIGTTISKVSEALNKGAGINTASIVGFSIGILIAIGGVVYISCLVKKHLNAEAEKEKLASQIS